MTASRRSKAPARQIQPAASRTEMPLESRIKHEVTTRLRRRLGLRDQERVPAEVQALVDSAAREVAESSIAATVIQEVETATRRLRQSSTEAIEPATSFSDLPLLHEAEHLAAKKKALQAAGFSSDDAMRILVAEVGGGSSSR
jgi:hypothetical protein